MKKLYVFVVIMFSAAMGAQNINFPDPIFKAKLLTDNPYNNPVGFDQNGDYVVIDADADGEISQVEALAVYEMRLGADDISDITGISYFQNLTELSISDNPISTIDLSSLANLTVFHCNFTETLSELSLGGAIEDLVLRWNLLQTLDITMCPNLKRLICNHNLLTELDVTQNLQLEELSCDQNQISILDVSDLVNLQTISCNDNEISVLDLTNLSQLVQLDCRDNQISVLDVSGKPKLRKILLTNNQVSVLDLTGTAVEAEMFGFFIDIACDNNNLSIIDTSVIGNKPVRLVCNNNPNLTFINVMNGVTFFDYVWVEPPFPGPSVYFGELPNLTQICANPVNFEYLQEKVAEYGYSDIVIDDSCTLRTDSNNLKKAALYPNPTSHVLSIESRSETKSISIFNLQGQLLTTQIGNQDFIDVSSLTTGTYLLKLTTSDGTQTVKFVKE